MENEHCHICHHSSIRWSAIFAGAVVGVGLGFLLHLFSMAIGLSAYSASPTGAHLIAIGGVLGFLIGVIVSMGAAGYVAGYLGKFRHCNCHGGIIYGFVTWSVALLLSALLIIPVTHYMSMYKYSLANSIATQATFNAEPIPAPGEPQKLDTAKAPVQATTPSDLASGGWLIFILFFIGAISCCFGACCGVKCRKDIVVETSTTPIH